MPSHVLVYAVALSVELPSCHEESISGGERLMLVGILAAWEWPFWPEMRDASRPEADSSDSHGGLGTSHEYWSVMPSQ